MGRPKKQTVDYFPHFVTGSRRTIYVLEEGWRNDGYAFWFKLLELLCQNDGHSFDVSTQANMRYLCAYAKTTPETAAEILDTLADLGNIDEELWKERKIIWCQSLVDNLKDVYDKRTTPIPKKPFSVDILPENSPETGENGDTAPKTGAKTADTPANGKKPTGKKPKTPKKKEEAQPEKVKYAEFVRMTEEEYEKLVAQYGKDMVARMIEVLDNYKGQNGKTYKSDYRAILNWVVERVKEEQAKRGGSGYGGNEIPARNNGSNAGGFKPSGGFKK